MSDLEVTYPDILLHSDDIFLLWVCSPQQIFILQLELAQHAGRSFFIAEHLLRCEKETFDSGRNEVRHALK